MASRPDDSVPDPPVEVPLPDPPRPSAAAIPPPSVIDDTIGVLCAFSTGEADAYAAMLEEILTEPMRAARLVSGLCHVAASSIDRVAAGEGVDRWEVVAESRHGLEMARRSNHPAHRQRPPT